MWILFVGLQHISVKDFYQFLTDCYTYGASHTAKDQIRLILKKLNLFLIYEISINGTCKLLCCKDNNNANQADMTNKKIIKTVDSWHLFPINWNNLLLSVCSVENCDQLIEVYMLDKNNNNALYHQMITELRQNQNLSVMLICSNTLVGYRSNHHQLTNAFSINVSLQTVILRFCIINSDMEYILSSFLMNCHYLKNLHITDCQVMNNQVHMSGIVQALKENYTLEILDISRNSMTGDIAVDLSSVIKNNSGLQVFQLSNYAFSTSTLVILHALKENCKLKIFSLNSNNMTGELAKDIASVITNNLGLEQLYLSNNDLKDSTAVILKALKKIHSLENYI